MLSWTWTAKTYNLFKSLFIYLKERKIIGKYFYSNEFATIIKHYTNLTLSKDWIGRLYGVINPAIDIHGNINMSNTIIEIDGDNTNNNEYLKNWIYKQLHLIASVFNMKNLYTYIDMDIKHVGPLEADNYLIVFDIVSRKGLSEAFKTWFIHTVVYGLFAGIGFGIYFLLA